MLGVGGLSLPNVGDVFGPYKILRLLGRGGMGVVFLAEQQGLSRRVALKVLAPQLADKPEFRERFHREAGALAKLSAPHVVHVYDFGEHAGCLFIAMQYIDGEDLGSLIKDGPLPADLALDICEQIADALVDAHRLGVVHRDIKPSNILVERTPDMVRAYLCDFGIARLDNESHTQTGVLIGSYGYMSPEQCRGESATEASDLYALGCVLVACLVGRAPYPGTDIEVATKHLTAPAPYWEGTDPVTTVLNQAVGRLMAKEAGDRYPNAQAVKTALIDARRVVQGSVASQAELTELGATVVRPHVSNTVIRPNPPALAPMSQPPMAPVGVTQVRSSIPSHDPQPANFGPTPPKPKTNTPIIAIGATFALLLIVVTATAIIIVNKNDDNTSSTTTPVTTKVTPTTGSEPTATTPSPTRSGGIPENPLGLSAGYVNLPCDGQYIVMLGTTGLPFEYTTKLPDSIKGVNGAKYLRSSESCSAFTITTGQHGDPVYNTYSGPYPDMDTACQALHSMGEQQDTAWVRQVAEGAPDRLLCMCNASAELLPNVDPAYGAATPSDMKYVSDMQYVLYKLGFNPERRLSGRHSRETEGLLMDYQSNAGLAPDGVLSAETWRSLQADWCNSQ